MEMGPMSQETSRQYMGAVLDEKVVMVTGSRRFAFRRLHSRADRVVAVSRAKEVTCHPSVSE
jgi:hypothetical protein